MMDDYDRDYVAPGVDEALNRAEDEHEKQLGVLRAEIARLHAALANYGRHLDNCPLSWKDEGACECGLDVALEEG